MDIKLQSALIAGIVSLIGPLVTYLTVKRQLSAQRERIEREHQSKFLANAYDLRLKLYPKAFEVTERAGKFYGLKRAEIISEHNKIADELRAWRNSEVILVISDYALECSYRLERELKKKPSEPKANFSDEQKRRMWGLRQKFRRSLREDLNLLLNTD